MNKSSSDFQSHNGAIAATNDNCWHYSHDPAFNPTMVRLLPCEVRIVPGSAYNFQSHNGAIAAVIAVPIVLQNLAFQSHNGAIAAG